MTTTTEVLSPPARTGSDLPSSRDFITGEDASDTPVTPGRKPGGATTSYHTATGDAEEYAVGAVTGTDAAARFQHFRPSLRPVAGALDPQALRRARSILDDIEG